MPRPKLSATQVRRIKVLLEGGEHTHQQIADKYKEYLEHKSPKSI
jgi:hypothetical protein